MVVNSTYGSVPATPTDTGKFVSTKQDAGQLQTDFLKMLTAQLEHQDPLSPVDNTDMTGQMAQFQALSEQQQGNELLRQLISMQSVDQVNQAVGYIGKQVVTEGDQTSSEGGEATVRFQMPEAGVVNIGLYDASGRLVKSVDGQGFQAGEQSLTIRDAQLPEGMLTFSVIMRGGDGDTALPTYEGGEVTGVVNDPEKGVTLQVNGHTVNLADVRRVERMTTKTAVTAEPES